MSTPPSTQAPEASAPESPRRSAQAPSGRLLLRMPSELHGELARAAEREGTSLNGFITRTLARAVSGAESPGPAGARGGRGSRDLTVVVLVANAVAVGAAALVATAILLVAWLG